MIPVHQALALVLQHRLLPATETVDLLQSANRVLGQQVVADRDFPPFHRVTMDGIAVNTHSLAAGNVSFQVEKIQAAGYPQQRLEHINNCIEVMTGAVLPENTDAVIPYEQCVVENGIATIVGAGAGDRAGARPAPTVASEYQFVHLRGTDATADAVLLQTGERITPAMIGIMASVGLSEVSVYRLPGVAICSTGDELVEITQQPQAHQVRRSNAYALAAALLQEGITANLYHLPDNKERMAEGLPAIFERHDVVLFSGAVSKGRYDYLPEVLGALGMQTVFHRVAQKPGKPLLFGVLPGNKAVFGLPGNPVSAFVCYHLYCKPWLYQAMQTTLPAYTAVLTVDVWVSPALTNHLLVELSHRDGQLLATPCNTSGSGDLVSMLKADAVVTFPSGSKTFYAGESFPVAVLHGSWK